MPKLPRQLRYLHRNTGAILFVALWTLVILTILAIGISSRVASEILLVKRLEERLIALYLAKAAVNQTIIELGKDETPNYDTLYELQKKRKAELGNGSFEFNLIDEESLININTVTPNIIAQLPGLSTELAGIISNSSLKPFQLKEELLLVEGVTPEIFLGFKDFITVYTEGKVNINTVSSEALKVLGLEDDLIEIILNYRKGEDLEQATEDDRKFENVATIHDDLGILTGPQIEQLNAISDLLCVGAKNLRLNIETKVLGKPINNYSVILERQQGKIRFWQER